MMPNKRSCSHCRLLIVLRKLRNLLHECSWGRTQTCSTGSNKVWVWVLSMNGHLYSLLNEMDFRQLCNLSKLIDNWTYVHSRRSGQTHVVILAVANARNWEESVPAAIVRRFVGWCGTVGGCRWHTCPHCGRSGVCWACVGIPSTRLARYSRHFRVEYKNICALQTEQLRIGNSIKILYKLLLAPYSLVHTPR